MSIRRNTDPHITQYIWSTIKFMALQKSLPSNDRVVRHLVRVYGLGEEEAQENLNKALSDELIIVKNTPSKSNGVDQKAYRLPSDQFPASLQNDNHDWYCYKCQRAGLVNCCQRCHRVFHSECHTLETSEFILCDFCEKIASDLFSNKDELNHILNFTCGHLKAKLPLKITDRTIVFNNRTDSVSANVISEKTWVSDGEDSWRPHILIKMHMDIAIMEFKTQQKHYKNLYEFQADVHNILHNILVYHGEDSPVGKMGKQMYEDCCYDLQEIRRCPDCYRLSNEKSDKMWFCIPCNPPHALVYAKQKGYPYWPAKVMQIKNDVYDVRFFGGHHMRGNIEKIYIRPINANLKSLQKASQKKNLITWNRAFEELRHHQKLLRNLSNYKNETDDSDMQIEGVAAKIRRIEKSDSETMVIRDPETNKKVLKDLRVKVERLSTDGHLDGPRPEKSEDQKVIGLHNKGKNKDKLVLSVNSENEMATAENSRVSSAAKKERSQEDMVTSSCEETRTKNRHVQTEKVHTDSDLPTKVKRDRRIADQVPSSALDKLRRELELDKCRELENLQAEHAKELRQLIEKHHQVISDIKKKQWCFNCEAEAIYHCCWNTAYCSTDCQQVHWQREHKRVCRRKR